ncbi:sensor histidine kinase [Dokdonella sp. MW10]|uniref:sensor histidine kinase n=1 Tax=Dokdonella sp. MW10 TaxID=2992926 RepID=UPI003F7D3AAD
MARSGLAARLLVLGIAAALVVAGIGGWWLRGNLHDVVTRSFEQRVLAQADRIAARLVVDANGHAQSDDPRAADEFTRIFSGWYWQVDGGAVPLRSRSLWDASLAPPVAPRGGAVLLRSTGPRGEALLGLERPLPSTAPLVLRVFGPADDVDRERQRIDHVLAATLLVLVGALALTTFVQVRLGLRPLARLRDAVAAIRDGSRERVGEGYGHDLDPLARELDDVLARSARVIARARGHAADLAHALKKPLAVLEADAGGCRDVAAPLVRDQTRDMVRLIDRHLARAGSGAGERRRLDVGERLAALVALMEKLHDARGLAWHDATPQGLYWRGEPTDFEEMLGNLLDNAGKWARSSVTVHARIDGDRLDIDIDDDGPGLDDDQLARIARRGTRFDERVEGSGLGLAITRDIAETYGGSLAFGRSPEGGLRVNLGLPA